MKKKVNLLAPEISKGKTEEELLLYVTEQEANYGKYYFEDCKEFIENAYNNYLIDNKQTKDKLSFEQYIIKRQNSIMKAISDEDKGNVHKKCITIEINKPNEVIKDIFTSANSRCSTNLGESNNASSIRSSLTSSITPGEPVCSSDIFISSTNSGSSSTINENVDNNNKIYCDKIYPQDDTNIKNLLLPDLDSNKQYYIYPDDSTTYAFVKNVSITEYIESKARNPGRGCRYNEKVNLYFCGKNIDFVNSKSIKCAPNYGMCRACMKINQIKHHLKGDNLINKVGRCTKISDETGIFHCLGHFKINDKDNKEEIVICKKEFICRGCQEINENLGIYFSQDFIDKLKEKKNNNIK